MKHLLYCLLLILPMFSSAQKYSIKNKKAIKYYEQGKDLIEKNQLNNAISCLNNAVKEDSTFVEAFWLLSDAYNRIEDYKKEIVCLEKVVKINPGYNIKAFKYLGFSYFRLENYDKSKENMELFVKKSTQNDDSLLIKKLIETCTFRGFQMKNPVPFSPKPFGDAINSNLDEYSPCLSVDGKTLLFTRLMPSTDNVAMNGNFQEDFYYSEFIENQWQKAKNIGYPINTKGNEGAPSFSSDASILLFTACACPDGFSRCCDIYASAKVDDMWSAPQKLAAPVNTNAWETQPCLSSDGRTLYFVSNRAGGIGKKDIWKSTLGDDGRWTPPVNLGKNINTEEDEMSPFIHSDNQTLYFASDGHTGMGGFDLFKSTCNSKNEWQTPVNLGYPINTSNNETGLFVNLSGKLALFSSNRNEKNGRDLFYFELPEKLRPQINTYLKGVVYDFVTKEKLESNVEIFDLTNNASFYKTQTADKNGSFLVCFTKNMNYAINVSKKGYIFYSENFEFVDEQQYPDGIKVEIYLHPIKEGEKMILKNIFFDFNLYTLKEKSVNELNKLADFLKNNPTVEIEIGGHTDSVGTKEHNLKLSENRAKAVEDYLKSKAIEAKRLSHKGYGYSQPIASNSNEQGRALNRRTEFKIIKK